jgi:hypothetical protein
MCCSTTAGRYRQGENVLDCLLRTRYSFESIRRALRRRLTADSFTFQTGSRVDGSALPYMVHDGVNGFLIESGDERGLAAALCALLADSKMCAAFGARGAALAEQQYTWENSAADFIPNLHFKRSQQASNCITEGTS